MKSDLHLHTTASDGLLDPPDLIQQCAAAKLDVVAITDHDTLQGCAPALSAAESFGLRVICGCEFSVRARWGEMHLLGYFLPLDNRELESFLESQRSARHDRAIEITRRLKHSGVSIEADTVMASAGRGGAVGRPHVARALLDSGVVESVQEAFDRYLGRGRPAFVPKDLPGLEQVTELIQRVGGVSSAAHLKDRATRTVATELKDLGVDGLEVRHPSHDEVTAKRIETIADELDMLKTGGSDWHGPRAREGDTYMLGNSTIEDEWLDELHAAASHDTGG